MTQRMPASARAIARAVAAAMSVAPDADAHVDRALGGAGRPLPDGVRDRFERSLGVDLGGVRVHDGGAAASAAAAVGARAFAFGDDVVMGAGEYNPGTAEGARLLAHEVAHTVQQRGAAATRQHKLTTTMPGDAVEVEADRAADAMVAGDPFAIGSTGAAVARIARWADDRGAQAVLAAIARADLPAIRQLILALETARANNTPAVELGDRTMPVAIADLHELDARARARFDQLSAQDHAAPGAPSTDAGPTSTSPDPTSTAPDPTSTSPDPAAQPRAEPASSSGSERTTTWPEGLRVGGAGPLVTARDAHIRISTYVGPSRELAARVLADYQAGRLDHLLARQQAHAGRDALRVAARDQLSTGGRALSEAIEPAGPTLAQLADHYAVRLLRDDAALRQRFGIVTLDPNAAGFDRAAVQRAVAELRDSEAVSTQIIRAAGRPNRGMTRLAYGMRVLGPLATAGSIATSAYRVIEAEEGERLWTAGQEATSFAGGTLGAAGGGVILSWVASAACGPGAVVCGVALSLLIVGGSGAVGASVAGGGYGALVPRDAFTREEEALMAALRSPGAMLGGTGSIMAGGGYRGLMERDRRALDDVRRAAPRAEPASSGGEAP